MSSVETANTSKYIQILFIQYCSQSCIQPRQSASEPSVAKALQPPAYPTSRPLSSNTRPSPSFPGRHVRERGWFKRSIEGQYENRKMLNTHRTELTMPMLHHPATPWHTQTKNTNQGQGTKYKSDLKSAWIKYQARWPFTAVVAQPQYWTSSGSSPSSRHPVIHIDCKTQANNTLQHQQSSKKGLSTLLAGYIVAIRYFYYYNCSWIVQCNVNPHAEKSRPSIIVYLLVSNLQALLVSHCDFVASAVLRSALVKHLLLKFARQLQRSAACSPFLPGQCWPLSWMCMTNGWT